MYLITIDADVGGGEKGINVDAGRGEYRDVGGGEGFLWIALLDGLPVLNCFCRFGSNDLFIFCSWMQIVEF